MGLKILMHFRTGHQSGVDLRPTASKWKNENLGSSEVTSIQLCSMTDQRQNDGYWNVLEEFKFSNSE